MPRGTSIARLSALVSATLGLACGGGAGGGGSTVAVTTGGSTGERTTGDPTTGGGGTTRSGTTGAGATGSGGTTGTTGDVACARGRVELDRPDDHPGAYQVHVNYVLPSDGVDDALDLDGRIATSVGAFDQWFAAQADGRRVRLDTCGGALDIRFVRLAQSEAALRAKGVYIRDAIEAEMQAAGLITASKMELVYYGGDADGVCGGGPFPPGLVGRVAALYLKGTFADPKIPPCASNPVGASLEAPGYVDFSALHEVLHGLGMAPLCAPHSALQGHVSDGASDLMYAGAAPWTPAALDLGRDDYFDHGALGCPDLARSVFLEPLPADAELPPGW